MAEQDQATSALCGPGGPHNALVEEGSIGFNPKSANPLLGPMLYEPEDLEADVAAVIEACGGDPRTAVKALLVEQLIQEQRIERLAAALSFGYVRGRTGVASGQRALGASGRVAQSSRPAS
ncbi:hypothetical protein [Microvirga sp. TS319]|uniref:hypothetical protein n=1 Tax=Microvirga sp. TS319 TaxID=3241165 RepID=UPI00351A8F9E